MAAGVSPQGEETQESRLINGGESKRLRRCRNEQEVTN